MLRDVRRRPLSLSLLALLLYVLCGCVAAHGQGQPAEVLRPRPFLHGRSAPDGSATASLLDQARRQHQAMLANPRNSILSAAWTSVGPNQVMTAAFGAVSGRVTSIVLDPADSSGNTVYVGTTGGGVWKSANAAGPANAVTFAPLTDTLSVFSGGSATAPSLSIGALAMANGVLLAGTGDPNDATDSYYGAGILRSADGGATWTLAQQSLDGATGNHPFFGMSVAGLSFSTADPTLVVAALSQAAEGVLVGAPNPAITQMGLYYSNDAGVTWHMATIADGSQLVQSPLLTENNHGGNAATAVVWNPLRQRFYAAVRGHGYYDSVDGENWVRLPSQPGAGLTTSACPAIGSGAGCPMFRGALAVQPASGDLFALTVDVANQDQGLYQDVCAPSGTGCGNASVSFGKRLNSAPLEAGGGSSVVAQADYNLALAVVPSAADTVLYVGTIDLYRCSLAAGCALRNTTNAQNGCTSTAKVSAGQHTLAATAALGGPLLFTGNDGGLWRSSDGVDEQGAPCSLDDANHFQNLNQALGSLAEVVSFAQAPGASGTFLVGLGALGTAETDTVTTSWNQVATGEGGTVAFDPGDPTLRYVSTAAGVSIARCSKGAGCATADFGATAVGATQTAGDDSALHAPWILDPAQTGNLIVGTCRAWRGPAMGGALWSSANAISRPFGAAAAGACASSSPVVRSLSAGGSVSTSSNAQNSGSQVIYAGMAGVLDGGQRAGGHVFVTTSANTDGNSTVWTDAALSPVGNDAANAGLFNPLGYDISALYADPHDATGATVYATVMGFSTQAEGTPHVYRSVDAGLHWSNISSNLPNAPANSIVVDPNDAYTVYVALDTGVYVTTQVTTCQTTNCWSVYGTTLPSAPVVQLQAGAQIPTADGRRGVLRAGTYGRGIWEIPLLTASAPNAPAITISPHTVTFAAQQAGTQSQTVAVTVTNTGTAPLLVTSLAVTGDYSESDTCVGVTVALGGICTVQVAFLPAVAGIRSGVLTVFGNVAGGQATASLSGIGTAAAAIVLTPLSVAYPATSVGATSAAQAITISNTGGTSASLQTVTVSGDFSIASNTCGTSLAPQVGCTVSLVFAPTAAGVRQGTLTVVDSAGTQVASLNGTATNPPTDALSPLLLSFAPQQLNTVSGPQQVMLTNAGDVALTLISAQVTSGDFAVVNACGNSLNAHAVCALPVTFVPKSVGSQAGVLTISDAFRTQSVALSGVGLAPPGVTLSPLNGLGFGAVGVGVASAVQTVTLTNHGGVPLTFASVVATGDFALLAGSNTCGSSLAPGGVCTVGIVFAPTAAGGRTGTVTFTDNASSSPQGMVLSGTGIDFTLTANGPASLAVASGHSATYLLLLSSAAGLPSTAVFTCAGAPAHASCLVNPSAQPLGGGSSVVTVTVATGLLTASVERPAMAWPVRLVCFAVLLPLGLGLRRLRRARAALLLLAMLAVAGCSSPRTFPDGSGTGTGTGAVPTPSGSYQIVVAGSSAGLVRAVNLTLVVQ